MLLGARPALCTLRKCYRFERAHYHVAIRLWDETRAELGAVRSLLIFAQSDWTRTWNTKVLSTDSSLSAWEMTHADWPELVVGRTGRLSERRRCISGGPSARESGLAATRVISDGGQWIVEGADDNPSLCGLTVVVGESLVSVVGPEKRTFSSWKPVLG